MKTSKVSELVEEFRLVFTGRSSLISGVTQLTRQAYHKVTKTRCAFVSLW